MKALITGGAGFIGSHLAELLLAQGHTVYAIDDLTTGSADNIVHLEPNPDFHFANGTVLDEFLIDKYAERCDVIYHLAAAVGVELIVTKPLESLETNIRGSEMVLRHAYRYRRKVLIASTSEIYGKNVQGPLKEDDDRILGSPLKSRWSYSTAKAVDEILAYAYYKQFLLPTVIVRLFNVVGPRQSGRYGMVLPRFVHQAIMNEPITVHGDGHQTRCFGHVKDVVRALAGLMEHPEAVGQVFNVGSQEEISILDLAHRVIKLTNSSSDIRLVPYEVAYEEGFEDMQRRVPSLDKIGSLIGWEATTKLDDTIMSVVEDVRAHIQARA